ncbi:hypothetical protein GCM10019059_35500 [Camelimonas fluminis]|uniref:L,D-transpeptidase n=1 Tax=Camelimonas fluminis TaxID=1576911 RepID=A0ABV7UF40_9HYPH|nr:L,D-transpeptidase [Camelimonas fluminis]GHE72820.1 hypothetical protein GCM10019059_35500 [Camelimonas fluminis]
MRALTAAFCIFVGISAAQCAQAIQPALAESMDFGSARGLVPLTYVDPFMEPDDYIPLKATSPRSGKLMQIGTGEPGEIIVSSSERRLYLITAPGEAIQYVVAVGRKGYTWRGTETITRKARWPDWRPPAEMRARRPGLPAHVPGGPENPLGARALYLGSTLIRIHGSNEPGTVGHAVSSGCIRMTNDDIIDLYERVQVGTRVTVR